MDSLGRRSRDDDMKWSGLPLAFGECANHKDFINFYQLSCFNPFPVFLWGASKNTCTFFVYTY